jgi:hypothetical protein
VSAPHFVSPEVIDRFEDPCPSRHFGSADYLPPSRLTQEAIDYEVRQVEEEAERMAALRLAAIFTVFSIIGGVMAFGLLIAAVCTASH